VEPLTILTTFVAIFPAELPDKTMVASMVLATRYQHPRAVWAGATAAFVVHVTIAATAGQLLTLLPARPVQVVVAILFAVGAVMLVREGGEVEGVEGDDEGAAAEAASRATAGPRQVAATAFGVVFLAEWGDLTQLATASLAASSGQPVAVWIGALLALSTVAAIGVAAGRTLLRWVPVRLVRRIAAGIFALLAVVTLIEAIRG
jgi:putative Ca2+/H+ antiporter (TMEM165/GDT1 family)